MHSVLLVIEKPDISKADNNQAWLAFQNTLLEILKSYENTQRLDENSLLINLNSDLPAFCSLINVADTRKLSYRVLFFEEEPQWIPYNN
jgi:hypothetical protein